MRKAPRAVCKKKKNNNIISIPGMGNWLMKTKCSIDLQSGIIVQIRMPFDKNMIKLDQSMFLQTAGMYIIFTII